MNVAADNELDIGKRGGNPLFLCCRQMGRQNDEVGFSTNFRQHLLDGLNNIEGGYTTEVFGMRGRRRPTEPPANLGASVDFICPRGHG